MISQFGFTVFFFFPENKKNFKNLLTKNLSRGILYKLSLRDAAHRTLISKQQCNPERFQIKTSKREARSGNFETVTQACLQEAEQNCTNNAKHCEVERDEEGSAFEFSNGMKNENSDFRLSEISENKNLNKTVSQMMNLRWRKLLLRV